MNLAAKMRLYDEYYDMAQAVLDVLDPCRIQDYGGNTDCVVGDLRSCCGGCHHLSSKGCAVKALACKMYLCTRVSMTTARGMFASSLLQQLKNEAWKDSIPLGFRASKEKNFHETRHGQDRYHD